jgi:hypothetical protein
VIKEKSDGKEEMMDEQMEETLRKNIIIECTECKIAYEAERDALLKERRMLRDRIGYAINYLNETEMEVDWKIDTARNCLETALKEKRDGNENRSESPNAQSDNKLSGN